MKTARLFALLGLLILGVAGIVYAQSYAFGSITSNGATVLTTASPGAALNSQRFLTFVTATGASAVFNVFGDAGAINSTGGGTGANVATNTKMQSIGVTASVGNVASVSGTPNYAVPGQPAVTMIVSIGRTNNSRYWFGLTDQTPGTMGGSDNPAGNYAAFRYSTVASDTTIKCINKDNTTQEIADSGVALTTSQFIYTVSIETASVKYYINSALVCTVAPHMPLSTAVLRYSIGNTPDTNTTNEDLRVSTVQSSVGYY